MRVLIGKPTRHIEMFKAASEQKLMYNDDIVKLYEILPTISKRLGFDCTTLEMTKDIRRVYQEKDSIFLAWHNHGNTPNTWFVKSSYLPDYFYFDKTGFSGWSELAETYEYDVDIDSIRDEVKEFANNYISNNTSRFNQSYIEPIPKEPYVVVFGQREDDVVSDFAYMDDFIPKVIEAFKDTEYTVKVKPHPLDLVGTKTGWEWSVNDKTGSLHQLIENSTAVYTVNSGSGFEALLHGKRVFTAGKCDYHWVTDVLKTDEDIKASIDILDDPVDTDSIIKFLHYCLNHHFMNVNDEASIERKLLRAVKHKESLE